MNYTIDATNKKLGRLASEVAAILNGKRSVAYVSNKVIPDKVVVKNIQKMNISEKKLSSKIYYHHTGYMGHVREKTLGQKMAESPKNLFRHVVERMLPKNASRKLKMRKLTIE